MLVLTRSNVLKFVNRVLPDWKPDYGWTYNEFSGAPHVYRDAAVPLQELLSLTELLVHRACPDGSQLTFFHDWKAAYKDVSKRVFTLFSVLQVRTKPRLSSLASQRLSQVLPSQGFTCYSSFAGSHENKISYRRSAAR